MATGDLKGRAIDYASAKSLHFQNIQEKNTIAIKMMVSKKSELFSSSTFVSLVAATRYFVLFNLFVTSKNKTANSPIHEFKVLHKGQRAFLNPFLMVYYFLFVTLKKILSIAFSF